MMIQVRDDPAVTELVARARRGDAAAWDALVERFAALVWMVCRRHRLADADADDVSGVVWLRLVERLDDLRDPAALPGWIATVTRRECLRLIRARTRQVPVADLDPGEESGDALFDVLLAEERRHALRAAYAGLPERCRQLLALLFADPPVAYTEISATLTMPIGAIGPTRSRCLDRLRRDDQLAEIAGAAAADGSGTDARG